MTIKELLIEADAIQVGVVESDWQRVIKLAARPLEAKGFISTEYSQAVIDNTLNHGAYYVFDEGIAIPHARPECADGLEIHRKQQHRRRKNPQHTACRATPHKEKFLHK